MAMHIPLLADITIIFAVSIGVLFLFHRLGIPSIVGFLLTGILAGPHGFGLVAADKEVEILAEIGVILLLFTIGIEFSLKGLWRVKRAVLLGGALQVGITIALITVAATFFEVSLNQALFLGFLVALSSTAIVLKALQDRSEIDTPQGRTILAILIFQDIIIVLMMLAVPILANPSEADPVEIGLLLGKGTGVVTLVLLGARYVVPKLLNAVVYTRSRELFLLTVVLLCFATAWLTSQVGLSLALGAFLAGLVISESEYSHQAFSIIIPFRDTFTSLFFVSVGMLLNPELLLSHPLPIIGGTLAVFFLKFIAASTASGTLGLSTRVVLLSGLGLSQIGEFSFILSKVGMDYQLISTEIYGIFIAISVLSMAATPFVINAAPGLVDTIVRRGLPSWLRFEGRGKEGGEELPPLQNHIVIIGYGLNGSNVARAARLAEAEYAIVELNRELVRTGREAGEPIHFGDAAQEGVLQRVGIERARVAVVVISDPIATRSIVASARQMNPSIHIIARTRFLKEVEELFHLGANEVIPEEYETSIEIFARVLACYQLPKNEIEEFIANVRAEGYEMLRSSSASSTNILTAPLDLPDVEIESIRIVEGSDADGKTLAELDLRKKFGATLLAIRREGEMLSNPSAETLLMRGDLLILFGSPSELRGVYALCSR